MSRYILILLIFTTVLYAQNEKGALIAKQLRLVPGSKAAIQWKRVFSSEKKKKKYRLTALSKEELAALKKYLIEHAADSPKPIVPGL